MNPLSRFDSFSDMVSHIETMFSPKVISKIAKFGYSTGEVGAIIADLMIDKYQDDEQSEVTGIRHFVKSYITPIWCFKSNTIVDIELPEKK